MLKTLLKEVKEYKRASVVTPVFMILEVLMETLIPFLMASIIDEGVNAGNMQHIYKVGGIMVVAAAVGLFAGLAGGRFGAKASAGFAKNLREAMFNHIQSFSFANIDHFSTAGLVTRMTTDVTNVQNAYMMTLRMFTRAPASMICAMVGDGICDQCKTCKHLSCCSHYIRYDPFLYYPSCNGVFSAGISEI